MELLTEKYRPKTIEDLVITNKEFGDKLKQWKEKCSFDSHILLYGIPGTGKSSSINVILNELNIGDYITINGSDKTGVDDTRRIIEYASVPSLDDKTIKLLNSPTNTLSQAKLGEILSKIREYQPNMVCVISLMTQDMSKTLHEWVFTGPITKFNKMFETVIRDFSITPASIRAKMVNTLKPTIVNNIAQLIAKYENTDDKEDINVSINTITRLVNMEEHLLFAEFKEV